MAGVARADISIPVGASYQLAGGTTSLACTDLQIAGSATSGVGGAVVNAKDITIRAGGQMDISAGSVELAQDYVNQGSVTATGGGITRVNSASCPAKGALGAVNPAGAISTGTVAPVPLLQADVLIALSLVLACLGGMRLRRRGV
ncbi:hypothetical protein G7048_00770 [Diaphorobacter sp. HDW4B]|uniref:hypothetical protein n=1 Tax=Diaphorobacter sp. HDW4B TaxID=2714925 RepID=UPI00140AFEBE|nr:hypothetical protein [Diaphorobacter sp. HDW4B]QIL69050.1 hypothetical protein G7048_00770 [Diaphorobacter sp. HDW4B]